jgi:hypothetical protein
MLYSGALVNVLDLVPNDLHIEDIAHALACTNRFGGHSRVPLSVAQHSVDVSRICGTLQGLLHDASEAYLGDIPQPLKYTTTFEDYREREAWLQRMIYAKYSCPVEDTIEVKQTDVFMLRWEAWQLFDNPFWCTRPGDHPLLAGWTPWPWPRAETEFLARFKELTT